MSLIPIGLFYAGVLNLKKSPIISQVLPLSISLVCTSLFEQPHCPKSHPLSLHVLLRFRGPFRAVMLPLLFRIPSAINHDLRPSPSSVLPQSPLLPFMRRGRRTMRRRKTARTTARNTHEHQPMETIRPCLPNLNFRKYNVYTSPMT